MATRSGGQDFASPTLTTSRGADRARVTGLRPGTRYAVVVRAQDEAGNVDTNARERSATTDAAPPSTPPVSFMADVQTLFSSRCTQCHTPGGIGPFSLEPSVSYGNIVNQRANQAPLNRVTPGDPSASYLWHKLSGTHRTVGGSGSRMPLTGGALNSDQLDTIRRWISEGAPNN